MPSKSYDAEAFEPRLPSLTAAAVCAIAALTLLWPLLAGQILFGGGSSDMYIAGYSFRLFGANWFKATGSIPQWNPYLYGGLPYIAAMHGDIFYPTAWLRWIMPVDLAITWGMAVHVVLAGWLTYRFARALGLSWSAAVTAAVAYELTGIVASQMSPGHDGKIFVSALTPLGFWVLLRAIRDGALWAYGAFTLVVALTVLGHYHMSYFLLIALALWTLYLAFWSGSPPKGVNPWVAVGLAGLAVVVGIGITSLQVMPFLEYIKYSPRSEGGSSTGVAFATSYAFPPAEIFTLALPQFNGMLEHYWGQNAIKLHTEYVGFLPLALAALAWGDRSRRRLVVALTVGMVVFLLFAFGGYSPLYLALYNVLPYLNKIRAMGMVFFLAAFPLSLLAGIGLGRVVSGTVPVRSILIVTGVFGAFALLGIAGALQVIAQSMAVGPRAALVDSNAGELRLGALRLLLFVALGGGALWLAASKRISAKLATTLVLAVTIADLWSIDRQFYQFSPRAATLFAADPVTTYLAKVAPPYRALEAGDSYGHSVLMAYGVPNALGYHGNELRAYDELGGHDAGWRNLFSPSLLDLLAIRFLILGQAQAIPGFHQVVGPATTSIGNPVVLFERDTLPAYARVVPLAAKVPDAQETAALADPRFPANAVVTFADTSSATADALTQPLPVSSVRATVTDWKPGSMTVSLAGADAKAAHLLVSENWYKDWHATVDGAPGTVRRADHSLLSVDIPAGAKQVRLWFDSATYARGKMISAVCLLIALGMIVAPIAMARRRAPIGPPTPSLS